MYLLKTENVLIPRFLIKAKGDKLKFNYSVLHASTDVSYNRLITVVLLWI